MHNKFPKIITLYCLIFAFSIACSQALMAGTTTAPGNSDKSSGANIELARDQAAAPQAITPGPVPANLIVTQDGLEWVYASPCLEGGCSNPSPTNQVGWRYATYQELTQNFPGCEAFVDKCASQYFDPTYAHCDLGDCRSGDICSEPGQLTRDGRPAPSTCETFYVKGEAAPAIPVPVFSAIGAAVLILLLVLFARRRVMV